MVKLYHKINSCAIFYKKYIYFYINSVAIKQKWIYNFIAGKYFIYKYIKMHKIKRGYYEV
ncbi:MAG TPA: hypothetical protein DCO89_03055 [Clostridiales bacterium]|nr:hypothetical protein [Clostridiales bacterium]